MSGRDNSLGFLLPYKMVVLLTLFIFPENRKLSEITFKSFAALTISKPRQLYWWIKMFTWNMKKLLFPHSNDFSTCQNYLESLSKYQLVGHPYRTTLCSNPFSTTHLIMSFPTPPPSLYDTIIFFHYFMAKETLYKL